MLQSSMHMKNALPTLAGILAFGTATAQIGITTTMTPNDLVQNVLLGTGVVISNVTFNGQPGNVINDQFGSFDGENCNVGIDYGVLLANGSVMGAAGPNGVGSSTLGGGNVGQSDMDLVAIGNSTTINDAAVLEFDFIAVSDTILFQFVFGSEEYLEFVNSSFNDVYGFFLSGPGINGPYSNNAINIALLPGTTTPITVDNVNSNTNSTYYVDNGDGFTAPYSTDPQYIQYDGFTVPITIIAHVVEGETHHMKIAIGDAGDTAFDSAVFLSGGSFLSPLDPNTEVPAGSFPGHMGIATAPNPASDRVQLSYAAHGNVRISVSDPLGRQVLNLNRKAGSQGIYNEVLDVSGWPSGSYHISLSSEAGLVGTTTLLVAH